MAVDDLDRKLAQAAVQANLIATAGLRELTLPPLRERSDRVPRLLRAERTEPSRSGSAARVSPVRHERAGAGAGQEARLDAARGRSWTEVGGSPRSRERPDLPRGRRGR